MARILSQNQEEHGAPEDRLTRKRLIEVKELWIRKCDEHPGCEAADPSQPCCGDGWWERISEE